MLWHYHVRMRDVTLWHDCIAKSELDVLAMHQSGLFLLDRRFRCDLLHSMPPEQ